MAIRQHSGCSQEAVWRWSDQLTAIRHCSDSDPALLGWRSGTARMANRQWSGSIPVAIWQHSGCDLVASWRRSGSNSVEIRRWSGSVLVAGLLNNLTNWGQNLKKGRFMKADFLSWIQLVIGGKIAYHSHHFLLKWFLRMLSDEQLATHHYVKAATEIW